MVAITKRQSTLVLHAGARQVTLDEVNAVHTPPPSRRWVPVPHGAFVAAVRESLTAAGFKVAREQHSLARNDARYFGVMDLDDALGEGVSLAVGIRSSIDQSLPLGFCAGNRVFVCDNLAFSSELLVRRKHTRFGADRFQADIREAINGLERFKALETARIARMRASEVKPQQADSVILRAFEKKLVPARALQGVIREWRTPAHVEFEPRTAFSLLQAFTGAMTPLARRDPSRYSAATQKLTAMVLQTIGQD